VIVILFVFVVVLCIFLSSPGHFQYFPVFLLVCVSFLYIFFSFCVYLLYFHFVNYSLNWTEAQSVCRHAYSDLATIENTADVIMLRTWIGLYEDLENDWRWSLNDSSFYGEGERTFRNWYSDQPNNLNGQEYCVELFSGSPFFGTWGDRGCSEKRHCFRILIPQFSHSCV
uniref:C-type lectin domain-containing protein n=1 Tax=Gouania willdenowi TaxID=441366 RepID=A0A8C5H5T6_GOUWI